MNDERAHPGIGDAWWYDLTVGTTTCAVQLVSGDRWHYRAGLVRGDELVVVVDDEVPPPRPGSLEIRTHGLWAEHLVETAFDHVSVGCEAFALRVDPPLDLSVTLVGDLVPFGLDLGWETDGEVRRRDGDGSDPGGRGYEMACRVYGEILVGDERLAIDGAAGSRGHVWGDVTPGPRWLTSSPLPAALTVGPAGPG